MWLQQNLALTAMPEDNVATAELSTDSDAKMWLQQNLALTVMPKHNVATAELSTDSDAKTQCGYSRT